jgi:hypothetical protein
MAVEFVETGEAQAQFLCGGLSRELPVAVGGQKVTDERDGQAFD